MGHNKSNSSANTHWNKSGRGATHRLYNERHEVNPDAGTVPVVKNDLLVQVKSPMTDRVNDARSGQL